MNSSALDTAHAIEADLRSLSVAARRQHPMVKEAAERGIIRLRAQKSALHRQIRSAVASSTGAVEGGSAAGGGQPPGLLVGEEILTPFVLACNHADASVNLLAISISAIQRLLTHDCIQREQFPNIMRVLRIQALSDKQEVLLKALQTMPLFTTPRRFDVPEDVLRQLFAISFDMIASDRPIIHHTASATLQQMLTLVFDRVQSRLVEGEDAGTTKEDDDNDRRERAQRMAAAGRPAMATAAPVGMSGNCRHAYLLFQDLCMLGKAERPMWIRDGAALPQPLSLEVVDNILVNNRNLFLHSPEYTELLKHRVCPLAIDALQSATDFPMVVRTMRLISTLLTGYYQYVEAELETIVTLLLKSLPSKGRVDEHGETDSAAEMPAWRCAMTLELFVEAAKNIKLMHHLYRAYDTEQQASNIYSIIIEGTARLVSYTMDGGLHNDWGSGHGLPGDGSDSDGSSSSTGSLRMRTKRSVSKDEVRPFVPSEIIGSELDTISARASGGGVDLAPQQLSVKRKQKPKRVLDGLHDLSPPPISIAKIMWHAHEFVSSIVEGFLVDEEAPKQVLAQDGSCSPGRSNTLPLGDGPGMVDASWVALLCSLENFLRVCNEIHVIQTVVRSYQTYINACGLLGKSGPREAFLHSLCTFGLPRLQAMGAPAATIDTVRRRKLKSARLVAPVGVPLTAKNVQILESVFNIAHCLGGILGASWQIVLETCEQLNKILNVKNIDSANMSAIGSADPGDQTNVASAESVSVLSFALDGLFESSKYLDDKGLHRMIEALGVLAIDSMSRAEFASPRASPVPARGNSSHDGNQSRGYVSAAFSTISRFAGRKGKDDSSRDGRMSKRMQSNEEFEDIVDLNSIPFAWKKLVVATLINVDRLDAIWELVSGHLETMCANKNEILRAYGMQSLCRIISDALVYVPGADGRASPARKRTRRTSREQMQVVLLESIQQCLTSGRSDVQLKVLESIYFIIQNCGQVFERGWEVVLSMLSVVATSHPSMVPQGFKSIQLIADDFLDKLPVASDVVVETDAFCLCIKCLSEYAQQTADVNVSLTAIGTLWALGDYARRQVVGDEVSSGSIRANSIWIHVLKELQSLSLNNRAPVRNCALQTMFATLVTHGEWFSMESWTACLSADGIVFNLMAEVEKMCVHGNDGAAQHGKEESEAYMIVHHSRDTAEKQWNETRVISLQELSRTVRSFFDKLYTSEWFSIMWAEMLSVVRRALLLVREAPTIEVAEVQREIVVAAVVMTADLMTMASLPSSEHPEILDSIKLSLWRPTWDTLRELGEVDDFKFDPDEDLSRSIMKVLGRVWKVSPASPLSTEEGQGSFFALADRILSNRKVDPGRYKHAKSPAEREYVELLVEMKKTKRVARSELVRRLVKYAKDRTSSPFFVTDAIKMAVDIWREEENTKGDYWEEISVALEKIMARAVDDNVSKLKTTVLELYSANLIPSNIDHVSNDASAPIWSLSSQLAQCAKISVGHDDPSSSAFLEKSSMLLKCPAAPSSFSKAFVSVLKQTAKNKESLKRDMCRKLLFSLGKNNDDDIIIDQCESVLEQYKNHVAGNGAEVSTKDLAAALESLLKVVQRESK